MVRHEPGGRLHGIGGAVLFSGLKKQVADVIRASGLRDLIGEKRFFSTAEQASEKIYSREEYLGIVDDLRPASARGLALAAGHE